MTTETPRIEKTMISPGKNNMYYNILLCRVVNANDCKSVEQGFLAGSTTSKADFSFSSLSEAPIDSIENSWIACPANSFYTRSGPNYNKKKNKAPSEPELLEVVGIE